ncbi:MAG: hypothetical protein ACOX4Z_00670 [Desulfobulbus sp.]|jgi:hypothetical protein
MTGRITEPDATIPGRNETLFAMQEDDLIDAYLCDIVPSRSRDFEDVGYLYNGGAPARRTCSPQTRHQGSALDNILGPPEPAHT